MLYWNWSRNGRSGEEWGYFAAVLMDLSKVCDTINHHFLVAKLHSYGVRGKSLNFLNDYQNSRYLRTKVNGAYGI